MGNDNSWVNLSIVDSVKDLGVYIDNQLDFSKHCSEMVKKANKILATFHHLDAENKIPLYKSLVRPYMEYGVEAWCPRSKKNIRLLESIQRRATKLIPSWHQSHIFRTRKDLKPSNCHHLCTVATEETWSSHSSLSTTFGTLRKHFSINLMKQGQEAIPRKYSKRGGRQNWEAI